MHKVLFLNSFLLCPQKKNIGNIRFILYITHLISQYDPDRILSLKQYLGLSIKPNELMDFFGLGIYAVRKLMGQDIGWLEDACWLSKSGKIEKCFRTVTSIRYRGYYIELEKEFLDEILSHLHEAVEIDTKKFGEVDSVYSLVLFGSISSARDNLVTLSMEGLKSIFALEDRYANSNNLYKKCIKEPCEKINAIYKANLTSKKIPLGAGDFIWVVGNEEAVSKVVI